MLNRPNPEDGMVRWMGALTRPVYLSILIATCCLAAFAAPNEALSSLREIPSGQYIYREKSGDRQQTFSWHISYRRDFVEITVDAEAYQTLNRCTGNGETVFWSVTKKDGSELSAVREDDELIINRTGADGKTIWRHPIDDHPWFQPLSYSLRPFLQSDQESIVFWGIRMDTEKVVLLRAKKIGPESIRLERRTEPAMKVEIRLVGLLSMFWHGTYWYSLADGLFLRFENGVNLPGAVGKIVLVERPGG